MFVVLNQKITYAKLFKLRHNVVIFFLKVKSKPFQEYLGHITGYGLQKQLVRRVVKWNIVFISPKALFLQFVYLQMANS